jgi:hypothetical protein
VFQRTVSVRLRFLKPETTIQGFGAATSHSYDSQAAQSVTVEVEGIFWSTTQKVQGATKPRENASVKSQELYPLLCHKKISKSSCHHVDEPKEADLFPLLVGRVVAGVGVVVVRHHGRDGLLLYRAHYVEQCTAR